LLALLFPGQGSQEVGMGRDAALASPGAREIFERADAVLGLPLSRICFEPEGEDELLRTEIQQPAILTVSVALLRALEEQARVEPACVAGHSLGEYTALVAAGALPFEDAVRIVHARGRYMQEAVPEGQGAMAAVIGCAPEVVEQACAIARTQTGRIVAPANYNGPQQTVISGEAAAVEIACARARQEGAKRTVPLAVSAPFHCALMAPAAEKLAPELSRVHFEEPRPPVVTNVLARANSEAARIPELLRAQVTEPVRFTEMIREMARLGVTRVLEIGPGRVLSGLVRRIDPGLERANLSVADELPEAARFAVGDA
jgi:[acyl-carrier-protein] S-malonyltransferase